MVDWRGVSVTLRGFNGLSDGPLERTLAERKSTSRLVKRLMDRLFQGDKISELDERVVDSSQ